MENNLVGKWPCLLACRLTPASCENSKYPIISRATSPYAKPISQDERTFRLCLSRCIILPCWTASGSAGRKWAGGAGKVGNGLTGAVKTGVKLISSSLNGLIHFSALFISATVILC
ncbi:conserved hypothetical protein [Trichinella spiralis]|uniref:hypothetical protein n=1 Tax=Trichinella spiralis TaxID=6334 RepID=UPI0001EFD92B|nr:conserved hypothetical protein [Trichinella spiralis]